jgi:hypothetical protein
MDCDDIHPLLGDPWPFSEGSAGPDRSQCAERFAGCGTCKNLAFINSEKPKLSELSYAERRRAIGGFVDLTPNIRRPVRLPDSRVWFPITQGHRPPYPPLSQWRQSAQEGCQFCQLVLDAIRAFRPRWLWSERNKYVSAQAIQGFPLQISLSDPSQRLAIEREGNLEVFTRPGRFSFAL